MNRLTFGPSAGAFVISGPARLRYDGTAPKLVQQNSNRQTIATDVGLLSSSVTVEGTGAADVVVSGRIIPETPTNTAGLVKNGAFTLELSGTMSNTYRGTTVVNAGTLALNKSAEVDAVSAGELIVGDGQGTDRVRVMNNEQIPDTTVVTIGTGSSTLEVDAGKHETIRSLRSVSTSGGIVKLWGDSRLATGGQSSHRFNGQLIGPQTSTIERLGATTGGAANTLVLGASSPDFGGTLRVKSGGVSLLPSKQLGKQSAPVSLTVDSGAWFVGGGTIYVRRNSSNVPANFKSGSELRLVEPGQGPRMLTVRGDLLLEPGSTGKFELNGVQPGDGFGTHSQLRVIGQVTLAGSTLDFVASAPPQDGHAYLIIDNDGTDPVQGVFAKHPEGQVFHWSDGSVWSVSYRGGDGNDVVLTSFGATPTGAQIPTVSAWGLLVLTLSLVTTAKLRSVRAPQTA